MTVTSTAGYELSFVQFLILPISQVPHFLSQKCFIIFQNNWKCFSQFVPHIQEF